MSRLLIEPVTPEEPGYIALKAESIASNFNMLRRLEENWQRGENRFNAPGEKLLGVLGEVHPAVAENFKFKTRAYVAEMNLNVLDESATNVGDVKDMPRFPAVQRDFAFVMKEEMPVGDVMNEMKAIAGELCEEVHLFDIYRGVPIQPGEKSVALSITLRAADRTLGEEEITAISEKIIANVSAKFGAQLRS